MYSLVTAMRFFVAFIVVLYTSMAPFVQAEELPDEAILNNDVVLQGPGQALTGDEMESLYLQSPQLVSNAEQKNGIDSISDKERYTNIDQILAEQDRRNTLPTGTMPTLVERPESNATIYNLLPIMSALQHMRQP